MGKHNKKSSKHKKEKKQLRKKVSSEDSSSSSEEEEWVEAEKLLTKKKQKAEDKRNSKRRHSSSSSTGEEIITKRKSRKHDTETDSDSNSSTDGARRKSSNICRVTNHRDAWMDMTTSFSSYSNIDRKQKREEERKLQKETEQYNPSRCPRELNPYWKDGGDGLPKFQKPKDNDFVESNKKNYSPRYRKNESNWKKRNNSTSSDFHKTDARFESVSKTANIEKCLNNASEENISEKELNLLAGKLVKSEIMGNEKLAKELREKLESARKSLETTKLQKEEVLLTQTDRQGHTKPLTLQFEHGEHSGTQKRKKAMETHNTNKERERYFADDDKYSLKQMFENEKFNTVNDQDSEFMRIATKIRKNDYLDDLFSDDIRRKKSDSKIVDMNRTKAISEHKKISESLDNCNRCIQSDSTLKHLIVSMGEHIYLSLPSHEPLTEGHCLIVPIRHVPCATQLDENEWSEILDFRKALLKLFQAKDEDLVFFECAMGFYKYPHMAIECISLPKEEGGMAPIYFKKAIDESETEWAQNKKLVSLKGRDVRRAIPKGLSYFSVSFGMEEGFAHVIEDEKLFPRNFAQEIIGGILDLHHSKWRKPQRQSFNDQSKRVLEFSGKWKNFDCTVQS